jgi:hypothetical protein
MLSLKQNFAKNKEFLVKMYLKLRRSQKLPFPMAKEITKIFQSPIL